MRILITGICGFVGSTLARAWAEAGAAHTIAGIDNLVRPGSETNRRALGHLGIPVMHGDIRLASDLDSLPPFDWIVDAAANPSVLAGVDGKTSSRQLVEHNLIGTINLLEFCKRHRCGLILLSTSRVYSLPELARIDVAAVDGAFRPRPDQSIRGLSPAGITEEFSTAAPLSLYGAAKAASEQLSIEYGLAFDFPVWINRCGVLAGARQFGRPDQGIFSYWIHSWARRRPLAYLGFDGAGHQVRDCLHPRDLLPLLDAQMQDPSRKAAPVVNVSGGAASACSLRQLSAWCEQRFGPHTVRSEPAQRPFDVPWLVLDSTRAATEWNWSPGTSRDEILEQIAAHADQSPGWLDLSDG